MWNPDVFGEYFPAGDHNVPSFSGSDNTIDSGATVNASGANSTIMVSGVSVSLINNGTINGNIDISGNNLNITNTGTINGNIINSSSVGHVVQNIASDAEFNKLPVSGADLYVNMNGMTNLNVGEMENLGAQHYTITNSDIYVDNLSDWNNWDSDVALDGMNHLYIKNMNSITSETAVRYVSSLTNMDIDIIDIDVLHRKEISYAAGTVRLNVVRETDYSIIFNDNRGTLLENIRTINPQDKLILKLDSAQNMSELNDIMNSSYRFNHKILTRPLLVSNNFMMFDSLSGDDSNIYMKPMYIGGDKTSGLGGVGRIGGKYENIYASVGVHVHKLNYKDSVNDFDVLSYGPDVAMKIDLDDFWIKGIAGFSLAKYHTDDIYYRGDIKRNPNGYSGYLALDAGKDFVLSNELSAIGFVGGNIQSIKVMDIDDTDLSLRAGGGIKYASEIIGLRYEYSGIGAVSTNGDLIGGLKFGFWSVADEVGVTFNMDVSKNKYDLNYAFSVDVKMMF